MGTSIHSRPCLGAGGMCDWEQDASVRIHLFRESFTKMSFAFLDLDPSGGGPSSLILQSLSSTI